MTPCKVYFISLGCDKNLVDSEQMIALLAEKGISFTYDIEEAEAVIINSCCFILDAKEESIDAILEAAELKKTGQLKALIVTGCLAERYAEEIRSEIPEVDAILGTTAFDRIHEVLEESLAGEKVSKTADIDRFLYLEGKRSLSTPGHYAYLKIAEGCDKRCTYCIIPSVRGRYRSVPMESLISDARMLAERGVKELILVAQETTLYGVDLYGRKAVSELLRRLSEIEGLMFIRLLYCYPEEIDDNLIEIIKNEPKICHYLDLPIQHISNRILKAMGRRCTREGIISLIERLRTEIPDIVLRTTLITGFPGETIEEHEELLSFVRETGFDYLGSFTYSKEEGTPAASFPNQISETEKEKRQREIMELQRDIIIKKGESLIGRTLDVMIEGRIPEEGVYVGRTYRDAPDVDGYIFIDEKGVRGELLSGDFVRARVTGVNEYDLTGELI